MCNHSIVIKNNKLQLVLAQVVLDVIVIANFNGLVVVPVRVGAFESFGIVVF